ncbi:NRDE family protein [Candidatus Thiothrix sp. Deng01]|uniref:NRDE family protein n=1 Tax=Candidatus Thiothrix phosphatis TaxID=3112415 RepID=A0ABU6D3F0_9GAMM|nr:NRDE family protein [Candidatus Thiothrix sp. Deng01]MEB4593198.1 NRDE family protein [Candidatus Thiothrix sp. Deng01]
MCFALLALQQRPDYPFILAANRDEFFHRAALPLHAWEDFPGVVGGRDVESAGSWLVLNQQDARLALVTNHRSGSPQTAERSRGLLVRDMVTATTEVETSLQTLADGQQRYAGFNLITGKLPDQLYYFSNRNGQAATRLQPGVHALSNAFLDTPWPKVQRGKQHFTRLVHDPAELLVEDLFALLADKTPAADAELPDTGIGLDKERWLSPIFISGEHYGTRCSTVILLDAAGRVSLHERTFQAGQPVSTTMLAFPLPT